MSKPHERAFRPEPHGRGPRRIRPLGSRLGAAIAIALLGSAAPARAQVFRLEAGSSSLYRADGGSIYVQARGFEGWLGLAALDPMRIGGAVRTRLRNMDLIAGDDVVSLRLPTDDFNSDPML